jgi:tetratricopeptide (TPR) repeat protein
MSSFMSSFIILMAVSGGVTVAVALLGVAQLRTYRERRARARRQEVAEQVKRRLADLRDSPHQKRVDQGDYDFEDTGHEAGQQAKESARQDASQAQGTVGQDADHTRAAEPEPWVTFHLGSVFDRQGEYDRAVEAYQRVIASEHQEEATRATFDLGILFENRGEYDLAEKAYRRAIDSEHSDSAAKSMLNLGVLFENRGEYDLAEKAYQLAIDSGHPEVAPEGMRNLRGLPMRSSKRTRRD